MAWSISDFPLKKIKWQMRYEKEDGSKGVYGSGEYDANMAVLWTNSLDGVKVNIDYSNLIFLKYDINAGFPARIPDYNSAYTINDKPTSEQYYYAFGTNAQRDYWTATINLGGIGLYVPTGPVYMRQYLELDTPIPVFIPSNVNWQDYDDMHHLEILNIEEYSFFSNGFVKQDPNWSQYQDMVSGGVIEKFTHYFYINGGILGKNDNYSVTEVITTTPNNSIKWVNNAQSKLFCYKYDLAQDVDDNWEVPLNANKLNVTRDSAFSTIMAKNSVSSIQQNVAFLNKQTPFFSYKLIPRFMKNGSVFTGTEYEMEFPAMLPKNAEDVNNEWANVRALTGATDARNEVVVKYGEPPSAQTPDENQITDDDSLSDKSEYEGDNSDDSESKKPSSTDISYGDESGSASELTKLYAISSTQLNLLGEKLWSQEYFDVLRIQDNPIENIVSIKKFPFSISGTTENIKVGNVDLGVSAERLTNGVHKISFGEVKIGGKYGNFLDFEPFTNLKIILPYIGVYDLPISELMNHLLGVEYIVDMIHGDCTALVKRDKYPIFEFNGNMGVNVPLTQTDRVSAETKHIQNIVGGVVSGASTSGLAGGLVGLGSSMIESGLVSYTSHHTSSGSGAINLAGVQNVRLIFNRPATILKSDDGTFVPYPNNYRHTHGLPYNNAIKIDKLNGFFKCGENIDLSNIQASKEIKDEIISFLQGGVYK